MYALSADLLLPLLLPASTSLFYHSGLLFPAKERSARDRMKGRIEKAVVLGAGTMGSRIAAHLANAGVPCVVLDMGPPDLRFGRSAGGQIRRHHVQQNARDTGIGQMRRNRI